MRSPGGENIGENLPPRLSCSVLKMSNDRKAAVPSWFLLLLETS